MKKLYTTENHRTGEPDYYFECPGCKCSHGVWVKPWNGPVWGFNGSVDLPTFSPSILVRFGPGGKSVCHSFVKEGNIQFLGDCTHELAGKTVPLPEVSDRVNADW